jgi:hypothetical protein
MSFSYGRFTGKVLAGFAERAHSNSGSRNLRRSGVPEIFRKIDMKNIIKHSERPRTGAMWQALPRPAHCVHDDEVIARKEIGILKRRLHCGSLEAQ